MKYSKYIGLIECSNLVNAPSLITVIEEQGFSVKKMLLKNKSAEGLVRMQHPEAELVNNTMEIIDDNLIDHIIVASPGSSDKELIGEMLKSGKSVQVV